MLYKADEFSQFHFRFKNLQTSRSGSEAQTSILVISYMIQPENIQPENMTGDHGYSGDIRRNELFLRTKKYCIRLKAILT
jgi:hypothetical protein